MEALNLSGPNRRKQMSRKKAVPGQPRPEPTREQRKIRALGKINNILSEFTPMERIRLLRAASDVFEYDSAVTGTLTGGTTYVQT
jgi:hypothetical protein